VTKTVALSDQAYDALARLKKPGQSFSEVVQQLAREKRPSVREVSGLLAHDSDYWKAFAAKRRTARKQTTRRVRLEGD
jgi:predicted CopG family antitoxin